MKEHELMRAMEHCSSFNDCDGCPLYYTKTNNECLMYVCKSATELINKQKLEIEKLQRNERDIIREFADKVICQIARNHTISAEWMRNYLRDISRDVT